MVNTENKKINKIEKLAEVIATNVLKLTDKVDVLGKDVSELKKDMIEVKKDITEVKGDVMDIKESNRNIHKDILNIVDRFVPYHMFDQLSSRVGALEKKRK